MKTGIVGASGYLGTELLRLCAGHDEFEVVVATAASMAGTPVTARAPSLAALYPSLAYEETDVELLDGLDLVFCALPHGVSQELMPALAERVGTVVDLAADFRLKDPALYPVWYGEEHRAPELLAQFVYGLPEVDRSGLDGTRLIAAAGCYPTAAALALAPLVRAEVIEATGIVVDAASGVSGAGTSLSERLMFGAADENFSAYSLLTHRHTPEIEQAIGGGVLFTPHLVPMVRGILATCYARPADGALPTERVGARHSARGLSRRAVRRGVGRAARHEGDVGLKLRGRDGARRRAHRLGTRALRHRQLDQGRLRPGGAVRQRGARPARDDRPAARRCLPVSGARSRGQCR